MKEGSSKNCLALKLEIIGDEVDVLYQVLKPDDVEVKEVYYNSELKGNKIVYYFEGCNILKIRNCVDDVLEKSSLAEEVIKRASEERDGGAASVRTKED